MITEKNGFSQFNTATYFLDNQIGDYLKKIPEQIKFSINEIRLKINQPLCLIISGKTFFLERSGQITVNYNSPDTVKTTKNNIENSFYKLCEYSVYSFQNQIADGFITAKGGHRIGICGTAVLQNNKITNIKDITSLNIRIAKEFLSCSLKIIEILDKNLENTLIIGPPSSGKTTILRDISRNISLGIGLRRTFKTVIIDERNEIAGVSDGTPQFDIGLCDVLTSFQKYYGITNAIRCLSPELIICDEIGTDTDLDILTKCANCGINIIASIHSKNKDDFFKKDISHHLMLKCGFKNLIFLADNSVPGKICDFVKASDLIK